MDSIFSENGSRILPNMMKLELYELEKKKHQYLEKEEAMWCLKSRVLWLNQGDRNTKYFIIMQTIDVLSMLFGNYRINKAI